MISVILATRNRQAGVSRLLEALTIQKGPPQWEVIIVDNGSTDGTPDVLRARMASMPLKTLRVEQPGKSIALNTGIQDAGGELLVFTDDDVVPDSNWLACMWNASRKYPDYNIFGGKIEVDNHSVPKWIRNSRKLAGLLTSEHDKGSERIPYATGEYPFGPNMAVRTAALAGIERPWPEAFGPGTDCPVGDEGGFLSRISPPAAGDRLFVPEARVYHEVERENTRFIGAALRCYFGGKAAGRLGLPPYHAGEGMRSGLAFALGRRVLGCRSVREFVCSGVRLGGFLRGRIDRKWV